MTGCTSVVFTAFIFGVRGCICHASQEAMRELGLDRNFQNTFVIQSIESTLKMHAFFMRAS